MKERQGKVRGKREIRGKLFYKREGMSVREVGDKGIVRQLMEKRITEKQIQVQIQVEMK